MATPQRGDFVRVRTRRWLVEDERGVGEGLTALRLAASLTDARAAAEAAYALGVIPSLSVSPMAA